MGLTGFDWVHLGLTEMLMGFDEFYWVFTGFGFVVLGLVCLSWVVQGFQEHPLNGFLVGFP